MRWIFLTRHDEAQEHFQKGLLLARELEIDTFQAIFTNQVGLLNYSIGKGPESMTWFKQAATSGHKYELSRLEGAALNNVESMHSELGQFDSAEIYLSRPQKFHTLPHVIRILILIVLLFYIGGLLEAQIGYFKIFIRS